jgi:nucleoside-diphosphate-sugar epimerase
MSGRVCVVTGASGAVGPAIVAAFADAGFEVRAVSRHGPLAADVTRLDDMRRVMEGAACVVHAAALLHVDNPPPQLHTEYRRINVTGTENLVRAAEEAGAERIVHISTISVYGRNPGHLITEDDAPSPDNIYGITKVESERIVLSVRSATVLRLAAVYGARMKGNYRRLLRAVARRRFIRIGGGDNRRTLVYDRDAASAAVVAATHPDAAGATFNVTDGGVHTVREVVAAMADACGVGVPRMALPVAPMRVIASAADLAGSMLRVRSPLSRSMLDKYLEDIAVSGDAIQRRLGFSPAYDLLHGWRETVALMRGAGER